MAIKWKWIFWLEHLSQSLGYRVVDRRVILKWILRSVVKWLRIGFSDGSCDHGYAPSGSINGGEFLDRLINCKLFKELSVLQRKFVNEMLNRTVLLVSIFYLIMCLLL